MNDEAILKVSGNAYEGWKGVTIEKSLRQMTGTFGLTTTDIYPGQPKKWNIAMGDECIIEVNDQKLITGYIEDIDIDYDKESHEIQFGGRDKTGDLIDCSYDETEKEWKGLSIAKVIKIWCSPFGISVVVDSSVSSIANTVWPDNIKADEGDTIFDLITKICTMKGILPVSYGDGKLTLTQTGIGYKTDDALITGVNILSGGLRQSDKDRFQTYIVKGQGTGNDSKTDLFSFTSPVARETDNVITRYRPAVIFTETACDTGRCIQRARWEKNYRAGNSRSLIYKVQGWTQSTGKIWPLNSMVQVKDDKLSINETLLISDLSFKVDKMNGTVTEMRLVHPDSFSTDPSTVKIETGFDWLSRL